MSKMDSFTVNTLLNILADGVSQDEVADLYKQFSEYEGGPTEEAKAFFNKHKDKPVTIKGTTNGTGTIVGLNKAECGVYPGCRFPIKVRLDETRKVYEFQLDQLLLLNSKK